MWWQDDDAWRQEDRPQLPCPPPPEPLPKAKPHDPPDRGVVVIPLWPDEDDQGSSTIQPCMRL